MISEKYREQLRAAHEDDAWGGSASPWTLAWIQALRASGTIIDYGCGKGALVRALRGLGYAAWGFDPAVPLFSGDPGRADMLVSVDALEHVEPGHLAAVLRDCAARAPLALHVIARGPAQKTLPDGRNAHLIQESDDWWRARLEQACAGVWLLHRDHYWSTFVCTRDGRDPRAALHIPDAPPDRATLAPRPGRLIFARENNSPRGNTLDSMLRAFTRAPVVAGKREAVLLGNHPSLRDHASEIAVSRPVLAMHAAARFAPRHSTALMLDDPFSYPPEVLRALADNSCASIWRMNYAPLDHGAPRDALFYGDPGTPADDWLNSGWTWFKASFPFALQLLYACGIRRVRCYGCRFEATPESTPEQRELYAQQRVWLEKEAPYFRRMGLEISR